MIEYKKGAANWTRTILPRVDGEEFEPMKSEFVKLALGAKNPFQIMEHLMHLCGWSRSELTDRSLPISMDASSSAYQIMSYFLLNVELGAKRTNLLRNLRSGY